MEIGFNQLSVYIQYIIMIVGCIEFFKKLKRKKKINIYGGLQIFLCFIAGLFVSINNNFFENIIKLIIGSFYYWLLFISLSTLFYDLIIKKINNKKEN